MRKKQPKKRFKPFNLSNIEEDSMLSSNNTEISVEEDSQKNINCEVMIEDGDKKKLKVKNVSKGIVSGKEGVKILLWVVILIQAGIIIELLLTLKSYKTDIQSMKSNEYDIFKDKNQIFSESMTQLASICAKQIQYLKERFKKSKTHIHGSSQLMVNEQYKPQHDLDSNHLNYPVNYISSDDLATLGTTTNCDHCSEDHHKMEQQIKNLISLIQKRDKIVTNKILIREKWRAANSNESNERRQLHQQRTGQFLNTLAYLVDHGLEGFPQNKTFATSLFKIAANDYNHFVAMNNLGLKYEVGRAAGVAFQDLEASRKYYLKAIENYNYTKAYFNLGRLYWEGKPPIKQDYEEALHYFSIASSHNHSISSSMLGTAYSEGIGVEVDYKKSYEFYLKAAKSGYHFVYNKVAEMLLHGKGKQKNVNLSIYFRNLGKGAKPYDPEELKWSSLT
mmetsp:Transcript_9457/g.13986  ORF Transcript_9457/g.13986 Transcript_9457/m.13986 type:complete len:448 (-) Transcript_9457:11-1354(-)